ncbi:MAG: iron-sulfur cluster carrier protein MrpORP [Phycisphaerae bacterium]|jgi:Mrp family chromosome partitioning ATPase/predicted Fe-Mo cluster-binding NifX family protein
MITHKIIVLSGKGGVGKSSVAVNLAVWLAMRGKYTGLLDVDIHGPSVPKMLGMAGKLISGAGDKILPMRYGENLEVMSIGFMLEDEKQAVIWRGPMKHNLIQQFVSNVEWGDLDYLIVDCPPGTGDEPLSAVQTLENADGAVVVTTPQDVAVADVRRCMTFCGEVNLKVLGVIENMSGFVCPHCGVKTDIFNNSGGRKIAEEFGVNFLGSIPIDAEVSLQADKGRPAIENKDCSQAARAMEKAFLKLIDGNINTEKIMENQIMKRIAIPVTGGKLSAHFGHCEQFVVFETDESKKEIIAEQMFVPPAHEPGVLPKWLGGMQVNLIISGGMGQRAQNLFAENGIEVLCGADEGEPRELVQQYLDGQLVTGQNICDH